MNRRRISLALLVASLAIVSVTLLSIRRVPAEALQRGPVGPQTKDAKAILGDPGLFTVEFFMFFNSPAAPGLRGVLNPEVRFGTGPTVWETLKNTTEIYRPFGVAPCPWETVCELPDGVRPPTTRQLQEHFGPTNSTWLHFLSGDSMIDGQRIVDAKSRFIRFDVRCNRNYFDYVTKNPAGYPLYNTEGQEAARSDPNFSFNFPTDSVEVKAAWRILGRDDDDSRFWTAYGAYYDENQSLQYAKIGLTAFHVISHAIPNWVWMTFEQVDNPTATYQYFLGEKGDAIGKNDTTNSQAGNYNEVLLKMTRGTKWQYYRIIGWQIDENDSDGEPVILANSNIETYFPKTSSCMSCHQMANIGPPENRRLNMWQADDSGIQGRVGDINFQAIAEKLAPGQKIKQMGHVWSLREAQSTQAPDAKSATKP